MEILFATVSLLCETRLSEQKSLEGHDLFSGKILTDLVPGNFGFAISVCRLSERGRMSKSVYVRVFHDLELLRYICSSLCDRTTALISRWDQYW